MALSYNHRTAFGAWINDMRNQEMVGEGWPYGALDDQAVGDIIGCLELQSQAGFNEFDVFGLLATYSWPPDIRSAADEGRKKQVKKILKAAHDLEIKALYGLGVYSWGFDKIIEHDPAVRGPNPHAMCGSKPQSWEWMRKVIDYILSEFEVGGFHLEASDQGRCTCPSCAKQGDVEYYSRLNGKAAEYIRSKRPEQVLMVNMCGYIRPWGTKVAADETKHLVELSRHLDYLIDPGHAGFFIDERSRRDFATSLKCDFGTSGGFWVYPPQRWERLRWFLPYTMRTGQHIKQLYEEGGRAIEYYMGPTINPGVEVNIAFGGRLMSDVGREPEDVLGEAIESLYKPKSAAASDKLVKIFQRAENAYFDNWSPRPPSPLSPPGELHLTELFGTTTGSSRYLTDDLRGGPLMGIEGRAAYKGELASILDEVSKVEGSVAEGGKVRIDRIKACIGNALADIEEIEKKS